MTLIEAGLFLTEVSQFWVMIACIAHDLGHIGVNNPYLVETAHDLALRYNDKSPLENMHCAKMFEIVADKNSNIFSGLERDEYREMRRIVIAVILHTDMGQHFAMMKEISLVFGMNTEVCGKISPFTDPDPAETEIFRTPDNK